MRKHGLSVILIFATIQITSNAAVVFYDDGAIHNLSTQTGAFVVVQDSYPDYHPTTVNLLSGGRIGTIGGGGYDPDSSDIDVFNSSIFNMYDNSDAMHDIISHQASTMSLYGGHIRHDIKAFDDSTVNIYGGLVGNNINMYDNSTLNITGGWPSPNGSILMRNESVTIIRGTNFKIDGVDFDYGIYTMADFLHYNSDIGIDITGILEGGTQLSTQLNLYDNAELVLIPEPCTLLLLALCGLLIRRK